MADCIRFLSMDAVQPGKSGHPGAPMGMADIATALFKDFMQFDTADLHWIDSDHFIMSNDQTSAPALPYTTVTATIATRGACPGRTVAHAGCHPEGQAGPTLDRSRLLHQLASRSSQLLRASHAGSGRTNQLASSRMTATNLTLQHLKHYSAW